MGDIHYYTSVKSEIRPGGQRVIWNQAFRMVHCCCVPGCSNRSDRERHLSFFRLPLTNKSLLKAWIHRIGRKNLPLNPNTRVCSEHFHGATKRQLQADEYPTLRLPLLATTVKTKQRKLPKERFFVEPLHDGVSVSVANDPLNKDASTQTNNTLVEEELAAARKRIDELELEVKAYKQKLEEQKFRILNIVEDDEKVTFYTGFQSFGALQAF